MPTPGIPVFEPWPHPLDQRQLRPDGVYRRRAWLPTVGPTCWLLLLWVLVAAELDDADEVTDHRSDLSGALGVSERNRHGSIMTEHLRRLCGFRLFAEASGVYRVRLTAPPVSAGSLRRLHVGVQQLHRELFGRSAPVPRSHR